MSILSCASCGGEFIRGPGPGRPRKHCEACRPVTRSAACTTAKGCATCGVEFLASSRSVKYCSKVCQQARGLTCSICSKPMAWSSTSKPQGEAAHGRCREQAAPVHGLSGYGKGCRCGECRAAKNAEMRRYLAARREREGVCPTAQYKRRKRGVNPTASVACVRCGEPLRYIRTEQVERPMHKKCRLAAPEWFRKGLPNPKVEAFKRRIEKNAAGTTGGKRVFVNGPCSWCGTEFTAAAGRYCSSKCRDSASFLRRGSGATFKVSPLVRAGIYERDSWTCQLCFNPVDPALRAPHVWSATLDHVIPQSHMLIPDHSPSNLRLAHLWCNSARGDGSNMTKDEFETRVADLFQEAA